MYFEDTCQGFSYSFDIRKRSERLAWLDWFTILKNIPTSSSGDTFVVEDRVFLACMFLMNLDGQPLDSRAA